MQRRQNAAAVVIIANSAVEHRVTLRRGWQSGTHPQANVADTLPHELARRAPNVIARVAVGLAEDPAAILAPVGRPLEDLEALVALVPPSY